MSRATVLAVTTRRRGAYPSEPAAVGSDVIRFADAVAFSEDGGAVTTPGGSLVIYLSADLDENVLHLAEPLTAALDEMDFLAHHPAEVWCSADLAFDEGEVRPVRVPHALRAVLVEGTRAPGEGEAVLVSEDDDGEYVSDVLRREPTVQPAALSAVGEALLDEQTTLADALEENGVAIVDARAALDAARERLDGVEAELVAETLAAKLADVITARIENLTVTGDAHLADLVAERIAGDVAAFVRVTADQVIAGNIDAIWSITTEGKIVAGDPNGKRVEMADDAIRIFTLGPNGAPYQATIFSADEISIGIMGQDGTRLAGITSTGEVTGVRGAFDKALAVRGRSVLGRVAGEVQPGWMDLLPRGLVGGTAATTLAVSAKPAGQEHVYLKGAWTLEAGRRYRIVGRMRALPGVVDGVVRGRIRGLRGTSDPTTSSEELYLDNSAQAYNAATQVNVDMEAIYTPSLGGEHRFGIFYQGLNNATPAPRWARLYVEDVGPRGADLGGGGEGEATKVLYQSTWTATASRRYRDTDGGAAIAGTDGQVETFYWHAEPKQFDSSAILFAGGATEADSSLELGKTLPQALNGATLHSIEVELRNKIAYGMAPGELIRLGLGTLGGSSLPSSATIEATIYADGIAEGSTVRVAVPTSWFTNGANRGITIGDRDAQMDSGAGMKFLTGAVWHGPQDSDPPRIHAVYSR